MRRWVCELGGAEMLLHGVGGYPADSNPALLIQEMQRWYVQFGAAGHRPVAGGDEVMRRALERWNNSARLGSIYWGSPAHWTWTWPQALLDRLEAEAKMRADTGASRLFTEPAKYMARPRRRMRR